jgi:hypothetical protein
MNLQAELEPLLPVLWKAADDLYQSQAISDPNSPALAVEAESGRAALRNDLQRLANRFYGYYPLDGHDLAPISEQFAAPSEDPAKPTGGSVVSSIGRAIRDVDEIQKLIVASQWRGEGAQKFYDNFVVPFKNTALAHAAGARDLAIGAKAIADGVEFAKACVVYVCQDAISRLGAGDAPGRPPGEEPESPSLPEAAGWTAILADAAALFTAADGLGIVLAGIGVTGGLVAELGNGGGNLNLGGAEAPISVAASDSAAGIIQNTLVALTNLDQNIGEFDEATAKAIESDLDTSGPLGNPVAHITKPDLGSSAYAQLTFRGPADPLPTDGVVTNLVKLYYAGQHTLPDAADNYDYGLKVCRSARIDGVRQFPRTSAAFNELAARLGRLMAEVREDLAESGVSMVAAASDYKYADEREAAEIWKLEAQVPAPGDFAASVNYDRPPWLTS